MKKLVFFIRYTHLLHIILDKNLIYEYIEEIPLSFSERRDLKEKTVFFINI